MRKELLVFSAVLIFLLLSTVVFAYEEYNYNPFYDSDILGTIIVDYGFNASYSFPNFLKCFDSQWNTTYQGKSGVLLLTNNHCLNFTMDGITLGIVPLIGTNFQHSGNATSNTEFLLAQEDMILPANHEGIVSVRYYISDNSNINPTTTRLDYIVAGDVSSETINLTQGVWHNKIIYIDADVTQDRTIGTTLYIIFSTGGAVNYAQIAIDSFKLFTLDTIEARQYWSSNYTEERERYCGELGSDYTGGSNNDDYFEVLDGGRAYMLGFGEDGLECGAFKIGNLTVARRVLLKELHRDCGSGGIDNWEYRMWSFRDLYFMQYETVCGVGDMTWGAKWLYTALGLTSAELTVYKNSTTSASYENRFIFYDYTPISFLVEVNTTDGLVYELNDSLKTTVDTTPYFNTSIIIGEKWRACAGVGTSQCADQSSWHDFFTSALFCIPATICNVATNTQYIRTTTCELTDPLWCGDWGCSPDLTTCAFGAVGDFCFNNFTLKHVNLNGTVSFEYCPTGEVCVELTSTTAQCMTTEQAEIQEWYQEPLNKTGEAVGYFLGWDMATFLMSLSLIVSILAPSFITYKVSKAGIGGLGIIFGIGFIGFLLLFTMAGWVDILLFIVLLILSGMLIAWQIVKAVGG